jgi:hypothetical protein
MSFKERLCKYTDMNSLNGSAWICAICSQGFTRKPSAKRHNDNLHSSGAKVVRPIEYMIGRLNGKFPVPHDPLSYRRNNKSQMNALGPTLSKPILDIRKDKRYDGNIRQQPIDNYTKWPQYLHSTLDTSIPQSLKKPSPYKSSGSLKEIEETKSKLEELRSLLNKLYPAWSASKQLVSVLCSVRQGDYDFLNERLTILRNIDRAQRAKNGLL